MPKAKPFTSDAQEVSARMQLIKGRNTKPELKLFSILDEAEISFERHVRIGRIEADARVSSSILIFVDSPFWHLRDEELLERLSPYWRERLLRNRQRDRRQRGSLRNLGYSVLRFWADRIDKGLVLARVRHAQRLRSAQKQAAINTVRIKST